MKKLENDTFYAIGEKVKYKGVVLEVVPGNENENEEPYCTGCYNEKRAYNCINFMCSHSERIDNKDVLFKIIDIEKPTQPKNATHKIIDRIGRVLFFGKINQCLRSEKYKSGNSIKKI